MFPRLLLHSFVRQRRRKLLACIAITLGVGVATAMLAVATDVGDKMNHELRSFGANILVTPQDDSLDLNLGGTELKPPGDGGYLREGDLAKLKTIFWAHNIVGFAPMLEARAALEPAGAGQEFQIVGTWFSKRLMAGKQADTEGAEKTFPWWKVSGQWPRDDRDEALAGARLAAQLHLQPGDRVRIAQRGLAITGIVSADPRIENALVVPLAVAQWIAGKPEAVRQVYVSALTKPEDDLARRDPRGMSPELHDRWYCSPYANSIAYQIEEAIPNAHAEQIRQVAQNEGRVLSRISGLMLLLAAAALLAASLAVSAAMATSVLERRAEIGLMKAIGASRSMIAALFVSEATVLALFGGVMGLALGALIARLIGVTVFSSRIAVQPITMPIILGLALGVTLAGSAASIRRALGLDPAIVLRGDA
ncbi:MAG: ABC transporter permease [Acidobacteria bacterium]|nr:ABC transporter permease [Acidobacteriota bacterium]